MKILLKIKLMKNYLLQIGQSYKWCLIFWTTVLIGFAVITTLISLGFKITYAPELENSWIAIQAVAASIGTFLSLIVIMVALKSNADAKTAIKAAIESNENFEQQHNENMELQERKNRLSIIPFLCITEPIEARTEKRCNKDYFHNKDYLIFSIDFENVGVGIAVNVVGVYLTTKIV
ncbi:MAG: hypothetical protein FWC09_10855 [Lachnospiraceae bacterium]|nr:hypothetical protein [Lachnospiraceae bacterium]